MANIERRTPEKSMLSHIKAFLESFKASVIQRIEHPLAISFTLSLLAVNWRPIAVLMLSAQSIDVRLAYIERVYASAFYYLWLPAIIAVVYAFVLPWAGIATSFIACEVEKRKMKYEADVLEKRRERDEIKTKAEDARPKTESELEVMAKISIREKAMQSIQNQMLNAKDDNTMADLTARTDELAAEIRKLRSQMAST